MATMLKEAVLRIGRSCELLRIVISSVDIQRKRISRRACLQNAADLCFGFEVRSFLYPQDFASLCFAAYVSASKYAAYVSASKYAAYVSASKYESARFCQLPCLSQEGKQNISLSIYIYIHMCIYIYIYREREREMYLSIYGIYIYIYIQRERERCIYLYMYLSLSLSLFLPYASELVGWHYSSNATCLMRPRVFSSALLV